MVKVKYQTKSKDSSALGSFLDWWMRQQVLYEINGRITTPQRYCRLSNLKVQRDYCQAIKVFLERAHSFE